jgi:hypothetical protein
MMKKILLLPLMFASIVVYYSCGHGTCHESSPFNTNEFLITADGGSAVLTSQTYLILCDYISVDYTRYDLPMLADTFGQAEYPFTETVSDDRFTVEYRAFASDISSFYTAILKIEGPWFTIVVDSTDKITVTVSPNTSGYERALEFGVYGHPCIPEGASIYVRQAGE